MIKDEIEMITNRFSKVMVPKATKPKEMDYPTILGFDIEDYGIERVRVQEGKKSVTYRERVPLGITLAYEDENGEIFKWHEKMEKKWFLSRLVEWVLNCLSGKTPEVTGKKISIKPTNNTVWLISHFAVAEFRHMEDWALHKPDSPFIGTGSIMHFNTELTVERETYNLRVIDSFAYFLLGLEKIAKFIGEEKLKIDVDGKDHQYWIEHMDELLRKHRDLFWKYAERDSVVLVKAWNRWRDFFLETFEMEIMGRWTPTIASVAASLFRTDYLQEPVLPVKGWNPDSEKVERWMPGQQRCGEDKWRHVEKGKPIVEFEPNFELGITEDLRGMAMRSYWGGRQDAFGRGILNEPLTILDFKGHYNRCGQTQPLPVATTKWDRYGLNCDLEEILKREGYIECEFKFPDDFKYPCLPVRDQFSRRLLFPLQTIHFGERNYEVASFTIFELRIAFQICPSLKIIIHRAMGFLPTRKETENPLRIFLKKLEELKNNAQKEKGKSSVEYHATKLMGNAMVGKFMQRVGDWKFEDTLELYASLDYDREKTSNALYKKSAAGQEVGSCWSPEWGALILGRARGLLGLGFHMVEAITGHTDSMVMRYDEDKINRVIEAMKKYDAILEVEVDSKTEQRMIFDAFWVLRTSNYVYFKDGEPIKAVHQGYSCKDEVYGKFIAENVAAKTVVNTIIKSWRLVKPKLSFRRNLPLGSDYLRENVVRWGWNFKRKIPGYEKTMESVENFDGDWLWTRYFETIPWKTSLEAWQAETKYIHKKRGVEKKKHGKRGKGKRTEKKKEKIREELKKGNSIRSITKKLKCSNRLVSEVTKEMGQTGLEGLLMLPKDPHYIDNDKGNGNGEREWRVDRELVKCEICEDLVPEDQTKFCDIGPVCECCIADFDWKDMPMGDWWEDDERFWGNLDNED